MPKDTRDHGEDLRGASRLAVEATQAVTEVVEQMHRTIGSGPAILGKPLEGPVRVATQLVYGSIRGVAGAVGVGIDAALGQLAPLLGEGVPGAERDAVLAALNGVLGDYLERTINPLALDLRLRRDGRSLPLDDTTALRDRIPDAKRSLIVLVHGSCMSDRQWLRNGHDHGAALARDLEATSVYALYNSGRHVSTNGEALAHQLQALVEAWPVPLESLTIVAFSMGGLVARSACRAAEVESLGWRDKLGAMAMLGTPHHGSPLERGGNWLDVLLGVSRYSAPLARLGRLRSAGITDLRFGNVLEQDWAERDRFAMGEDPRTPVPLPSGVKCFAVAGTGKGRGDGLVPIESALGKHADPVRDLSFPEAHRATADVIHLDLLSADVYPVLRDWMQRSAIQP